MSDPIDDARVRALVGAILDRPRYRAFRPESDDFKRILADCWRKALTFLLELYDDNPVLYWLLLIGLSVVCVALLAHITWTLLGALRAQPHAPSVERVPDEIDFAQQAQQLAERGQHLEAAHRLLLAGLRALAKGRHIALQPEDGNRAVCRKVARSGLPQELREQLIGLIAQTEHVWFGGAGDDGALGRELYQRWRAALAQLARAASS